MLSLHMTQMLRVDPETLPGNDWRPDIRNRSDPRVPGTRDHENLNSIRNSALDNGDRGGLVPTQAHPGVAHILRMRA